MAVRVERFAENPLIMPSQVTPSREGWEVACTFNPGAIEYEGEVLLLVRVAERPAGQDPDEMVAPILDVSTGPPRMELLRVRRDDPDLVTVDPRWFVYRGQMYLTSISHLRVARSQDGRHFTVESRPAFFPETWYETFGVEDPRITKLEGQYLISYTSVSAHGIATSLATTPDFRGFTRHGMIFAPENRDVSIFPEKVGGQYFCHHRAIARHIGGFDMWAANSPDLVHWGQHSLLMSPRPGTWEAGRIGGGSVPFRTEQGWLTIYHGADQDNRYYLGALLCDGDDPRRVIARSGEPLLTPEAPYEVTGFLGNVVFSCGTVVRGDELTIYYGAADQYVCGAVVSVGEVLESLAAEESRSRRVVTATAP